MTIPAITPLPTAPTVTDDRATFNTRAFNLWLAQQGLVTEVNAATAAFAVDAAAAVAAAAAQATTAGNSATAAAGSATAAGNSATAAATSAAAAVGSAPFTHLVCASVVASASVTMINGVRAISLDANRDLVLTATNNGLFGVVYDASSSTFGSVVLVRSGAVPSKAGLRLVSAGTDKVLVTSCISADLQGVVLSITGTSIAVGTAANVLLGGAISGMAPMVAVGAAWVQGYNRATTTAGYIAITVSGTTVTMGAEVTEAIGSPNAQPVIFGIDSTKFLSITVGATQMYARPHSVSGTTITPGTISAALTVTAAIRRAVYLPASGRWMVFYTNSSGQAALVSVSGTTASVSAPVATSVAMSGNCSMTVISGMAKAFLVSTTSVNVVTDNAGTPVAGTAITHQLNTAVCMASDASTVTLSGRDGAASFSESGGSPAFLWHRLPGPFNSNSATYHAEVGGNVTDMARVTDDPRSDSVDCILVGSECATLLPLGTAQPFVMTVRGRRSESRLSAGVSVGTNAERISRVSNSVAWVVSANSAGTTRIQLEKIQSL